MSTLRHLLIVNPNTSTSVSDLLQRHAQAAASPDLVVRTVTARFGAPYIACEASYAVAGHALLDAWSAALLDGEPTPQAVLIGCFGDPALQALRESSPVPVCGLAQASFAQAARLGRFVVVTGGARWAPMLRRLADALGVGSALAGIHTVAPSGAQLAADPVAASDRSRPVRTLCAVRERRRSFWVVRVWPASRPVSPPGGGTSDRQCRGQCSRGFDSPADSAAASGTCARFRRSLAASVARNDLAGSAGRRANNQKMTCWQIGGNSSCVCATLLVFD